MMNHPLRTDNFLKKTTRCILHARYCFLCLAPFILTIHSQGADPAGQWNIKVIGVMVAAPGEKEGSHSFCWKPGVTVSTSVRPDAGKIVKVNEFRSKLESFTDDKGTDLMAAPPSKDPFNKPGLSVQTSSDDQGDVSVIMDIKASGHPAKGATSFNISGKLAADVAGASKQLTVESVAIVTNAQFALGDLALTITEASLKKNSFGKGEEYSVTFSSPQDLKSISSLEFFDAQGNKIDARKRSWGDGSLGSMVEYVFKKKVDNVKIVATCWQDLKSVEVPFSITTGLGL